MKTDPKLGAEIARYLKEVGLETPTTEHLNLPSHQKIELITDCMTLILEILGLDLSDDSLADTPARVAKMFVNELYYGLLPENFPKCTAVENKMGYDEMVIEKNIKVMSDCEHHLRPIHGVAHVAYIPKGKVLGLSKLNRIVNYFARRPQIQERLASQIHAALCYILDTADVAVVIEAEHFCVKQRGIEDVGSSTVTSRLSGVFIEEPDTRAEFMSLIRS